MKRPVKRSIAAASRKPVVPQIDPITLLENSGYKRVGPNGHYWQIRGRRMTTAVLCRTLGISTAKAA